MVKYTPEERAKALFSERLNERLDELGYPPLDRRGRHTAVGNDFDVSYQSAKKWLTGVSLPELNRCIVMADKYGITLEWLMTGKGTKYSDSLISSKQQAVLDMWDAVPEEYVPSLEAQIRALAQLPRN